MSFQVNSLRLSIVHCEFEKLSSILNAKSDERVRWGNGNESQTEESQSQPPNVSQFSADLE